MSGCVRPFDRQPSQTSDGAAWPPESGPKNSTRNKNRNHVLLLSVRVCHRCCLGISQTILKAIVISARESAPDGRFHSNVANGRWQAQGTERIGPKLEAPTAEASIEHRDQGIDEQPIQIVEKRKDERDARKAAKERENELREEMRQAAIAKKERRLENERRRAENEFKNAQNYAQNLSRNADTKMKAMSKKQLRQIKKTRMNSKTGVVEYVSAYAK